jgi:AraC family transcriptional regulator
MNQGGYGSGLGSAFRMPDAPTLITRVLPKSTLAVTELRYDQPDFGESAPVPQEDASLVVLHVNGCSESLYFEGRLRQRERHSGGATSIYDLRRSPVTNVHDPYHSLVFYLPRTALDDLCSEAGVRRVGDLRHQFGASTGDPVTRHLLSSVLPALAKPQEASALFLDYVALAMTAHMATVYGGMDRTATIPRSGLAPWQERRAKELLIACLHDDLPLSHVAMECGLSVRHFSRAFRLSTGLPPHRWLMKQRVDRARELLRARVLSLADVAHFCGFADQSHFTRVFTALVGTSPGAWRREAQGLKTIAPSEKS